MRILAIAGGVPTVRAPSKQVFYLSLLEQFCKAGHDVSLIVPLKLGLGRSGVLVPEQIRVAYSSYLPTLPLRFTGFDGRRCSLASLVSGVWRAFKELKSNPDAIFGHFFLPAGVAAVEISRRTGIPAFCSLGESRCERWSSVFSAGEIAATMRQFECIFPVAEHIRKFLISRCEVDADRIQVVPNGIDASLFHRLDKRECRNALGIDQQRKVALFVGSADERKGAALLRQAAARLPREWEVWIVGEGHKASISRNIKVWGAVTHDQLPRYYNAADVFVLPSQAEGMPNALLEAMACETPAVVSRIPPTLEVLGETYPLFCELAPDAIAECIVRSQSVAPGRLFERRPLSLEERASSILCRMAGSHPS